MKNYFGNPIIIQSKHKILFIIIFLLGALLISQYSLNSKDSLTTNHGKKWRIGYYEGGPWIDYQGYLLGLIDGLTKLGWMEEVAFPKLPDNSDTQKAWAWLSEHAESKYIEFVPDAYWSADWDSDLREKNRTEAIQRLKEKKYLDLIIVAGTWGGVGYCQQSSFSANTGHFCQQSDKIRNHQECRRFGL